MRNKDGTFATGNDFGGSSKKTIRLKAILYDAVDDKSFKKVIKNLLSIASNPENPSCAIKACDLLFNRLLGAVVTKIEAEVKSDTQNPEETRQEFLRIFTSNHPVFNNPSNGK